MTEPSTPPGDTPRPPACYGWLSDLPGFYGAQPRVIRLKLEHFI